MAEDTKLETPAPLGSRLRGKGFRFWSTVSILALVIVYLSLTISAYWFVRHVRNIEGVTYLDLALPNRWSHYQVARGNHHIATGIKLLQSGKYFEGFQLIRVGLARAPQNQEGRLTLTALYAQSGRPDLAQATLLDGLAYHSSNATYVSTVLEFLSSQSQDRQSLTLCDQLLSNSSTPRNIKEIAAARATLACIFMGNYDRAESYLADNQMPNSRDGRLLKAQIEWERGYHELALVLLRDLHGEFPDAEDIYSKLASYLAEAGNEDELRRLAVLHQLAYPDRPRSHIDQLVAIKTTGDNAALERAESRAFEQFADTPAGLLTLADYAATNGRVALAKRIFQTYRDKNWPDVTAAQLMSIEAQLAAKEYAPALEQCRALLAQTDLAAQYANIATGLQAIAQYGTSDPVAGYASLAVLKNQSGLRAESLLGIANRLQEMNRMTAARDILAQAVKVNPKNQAALTRLIELDLDTDNLTELPASLRTLTGMRKPSPILLKRARSLLSKDTWLFLPQRNELLARLDESLTSGTQL